MATKTKKELQQEVTELSQKLDVVQTELTHLTTSKGSLPIDKMHLYMNYLLTGEVTSDEHAEQINEISKLGATVADATILARLSLTQIMKEFDEKLTSVMEKVHVQGEVLNKLGATEEMFEEVKKDFDKKVQDMMDAQLSKEEEEAEEK